MKKTKKIIIGVFVGISLFTGIGYGTQTITSLTQTVSSGNTIDPAWYNAVNTKLNALSNGGGGNTGNGNTFEEINIEKGSLKTNIKYKDTDALIINSDESIKIDSDKGVYINGKTHGTRIAGDLRVTGDLNVTGNINGLSNSFEIKNTGIIGLTGLYGSLYNRNETIGCSSGYSLISYGITYLGDGKCNLSDNPKIETLKSNNSVEFKSLGRGCKNAKGQILCVKN